MKYVITWHERNPGSSEYEALQKQVLEIFKGKKLPVGCTIHQCLVRTGEFGGYMFLETDSPETDTLPHLLHPLIDRLDNHLRSAFEIKIDPVVDVTDAVVATVT